MAKKRINMIGWEPHNGCGDCIAARAQGPDGAPTAPLRTRLVAAMLDQFGDDKKRIDHALAVLSYAEEIRNTEGGDALVVTAAPCSMTSVSNRPN
jgi:hypothetical protein